MNYIHKIFFQKPSEKNVIYFNVKSNQLYRRLTEIRACALRIDLKFEMGLSPRMHQTSNNRCNPNGYGSLRVTLIACLTAW